MIKEILIRFNEYAKRHNLYFFSSLFFALSILLLSVIPAFGGGINSGFHAHAPGYFVFSLTIALSLRAKNSNRPLIKGALMAGAYGMLIELIQFFIPYRNFELTDILFNFAAAMLAIIPSSILIKKKWI